MTRRRDIIYSDDQTCKNLILCCIPAIILTDFFYTLFSCFSTSSTKINVKK